jgi:hypothetical protein
MASAIPDSSPSDAADVLEDPPASIYPAFTTSDGQRTASAAEVIAATRLGPQVVAESSTRVHRTIRVPPQQGSTWIETSPVADLPGRRHDRAKSNEDRTGPYHDQVRPLLPENAAVNELYPKDTASGRSNGQPSRDSQETEANWAKGTTSWEERLSGRLLQDAQGHLR